MPQEKFLLTREQFGEIMPSGEKAGRLSAHWPFVNDALEWGEITTRERVAAFMAQLAHESGEYRYMEELASGAAYEGRGDLGNTQPGDGKKFKGHGPIQITGRANHKACGLALGLDLINQPTLITTPEHGTRSAVWFWISRDLNGFADVGNFKEITRRINGGYNGWEDRLSHWARAKAVVGLETAGLTRLLQSGVPDGDDIRELQTMLNKVGGLPFPLEENGRFDQGTLEHVLNFQQVHGLDADGKVGRITWGKLKELTA